MRVGAVLGLRVDCVLQLRVFAVVASPANSPHSFFCFWGAMARILAFSHRPRGVGTEPTPKARWVCFWRGVKNTKKTVNFGGKCGFPRHEI